MGEEEFSGIMNVSKHIVSHKQLLQSSDIVIRGKISKLDEIFNKNIEDFSMDYLTMTVNVTKVIKGAPGKDSISIITPLSLYWIGTGYEHIAVETDYIFYLNKSEFGVDEDSYSISEVH